MALTEGAPNVMQRLAGLPTAPHVDPLLSGKPVPFSLCHKHHLHKMNSYQMVLHRPVETAHEVYRNGCSQGLDLDRGSKFFGQACDGKHHRNQGDYDSRVRAWAARESASNV